MANGGQRKRHTMETLFALVLLVSLPTGETHSFVADTGLTAEDCRDAASVRQVPGAPFAWVCEAEAE